MSEESFPLNGWHLSSIFELLSSCCHRKPPIVGPSISKLSSHRTHEAPLSRRYRHSHASASPASPRLPSVPPKCFRVAISSVSSRTIGHPAILKPPIISFGTVGRGCASNNSTLGGPQTTPVWFPSRSGGAWPYAANAAAANVATWIVRRIDWSRPPLTPERSRQSRRRSGWPWFRRTWRARPAAPGRCAAPAPVRRCLRSACRSIPGWRIRTAQTWQ